MNHFIEECRREWRRMRVPKPVADDMAAELENDLTEAAAEGVTAEELLGAPRAFAATWAAARGIRRRRPVFLIAAIAALLALALSGAGLALFGGASRTVRAAGPRTLLVRPAPAPDPTAVRIWVSGPRSVESMTTEHHTRLIGVVLLIVGLSGTTILSLLPRPRPAL